MLGYLDAVFPYLHRDLVSSHDAAELRALARRLPSCDLAGFECRLGRQAAPVDFIVRLPRGACELPAELLEHGDWQAVQRLCARLEAPRSPLAGRVNVIDLELDLPAAPLPVPAIFFELQRERRLSGDEVVMLAELLVDGSVSREIAAALRRAVELLPEPGRLIHLGAMRSRGAAGFRLVASRLGASAWPEYLAALGWPGRGEALAGVLAGLHGHVDSVAISFDIVDTVLPRIGVEGFVFTKGERQARWAGLLGQLRERELCTNAQAEALLGWPGVSRPELGMWPATLGWGDRLLAGHAASVISRFLSHVKVICNGDEALAAKAYFGFAHYWTAPASGIGAAEAAGPMVVRP